VFVLPSWRTISSFAVANLSPQSRCVCKRRRFWNQIRICSDVIPSSWEIKSRWIATRIYYERKIKEHVDNLTIRIRCSFE
jgi:hypothetical protein